MNILLSIAFVKAGYLKNLAEELEEDTRKAVKAGSNLIENIEADWEDLQGGASDVVNNFAATGRETVSNIRGNHNH